MAAKKGKATEELTVAVGCDPRLSGPALTNAMFAGMAAKGCGTMYDMGLATTPACFMSTVTPSTMYDAGVMLTASHLPFKCDSRPFNLPPYQPAPDIHPSHLTSINPRIRV